MSLFANSPISDSGCASLALRALPLMHIRAVGAVHITAVGAFRLVGVLIVIGPLYATMAAALLAIGIKIADFSALTGPIQPLNKHILFLHLFYPPNRHKVYPLATLPMLSLRDLM